MFGGGPEGGVAHFEGIEQAFLEELLEGFCGDDFDDAAQGVDACGAVGPLTARIEAKRGAAVVVDEFSKADFVASLSDLGDAALVGEQIAYGHGARGWTLVAFLFGDLLGAEGGDEFVDGILEGKLALFDEHEDADGGNGFGHGGDPEQVVWGHGPARGEVAVSEGSVVEDALVIGDQRDHSGDGAVIDEGLHGLGDGLILRGIGVESVF